jgi:hypothetical protein
VNFGSEMRRTNLAILLVREASARQNQAPIPRQQQIHVSSSPRHVDNSTNSMTDDFRRICDERIQRPKVGRAVLTLSRRSIGLPTWSWLWRTLRLVHEGLIAVSIHHSKRDQLTERLAFFSRPNCSRLSNDALSISPPTYSSAATKSPIYSPGHSGERSESRCAQISYRIHAYTTPA